MNRRTAPVLLTIAFFYLQTLPLAGQASHSISTLQLRALRNRCAPDAPISVLSGIVFAESSGYPNAINIDFPQSVLKRWGFAGGEVHFRRQPRSATEAASWANYLINRGVSVALGLMQVSTQDVHALLYSPAQLLDECTNVRIGWTIFRDHYAAAAERFGPGQNALDHAISRYNTGHDYAGINNGYLDRVISALRRLPAEPEQGY